MDGNNSLDKITLFNHGQTWEADILMSALVSEQML